MTHFVVATRPKRVVPVGTTSIVQECRAASTSRRRCWSASSVGRTRLPVETSAPRPIPPARTEIVAEIVTASIDGPTRSGPAEEIRPRWGLGDFFIAWGIWFVVQVVVGVGIVLVGGFGLDSEDDPSAVLDEVGVGGLAVFLLASWFGWLVWPAIMVRIRGLGSFRRDLGLSLRRSDVLPGLLGGGLVLVFGMLLNLLWVLISQGGDPPDNTQSVPEGTSVATWALLFVLIAVGAPIVEEIFFRGLLLRSVAKRWSVTAGVVTSSVVFGVSHYQFRGFTDLYVVVLLCVYGYVLAILTVRSRGRLGPAMVAHGVNNGVAIAIVALTAT